MAEIRSVMTADPARCHADTPLRDVARLMVEHDCGQIPVVDGDGRPVGVVTDRDIAVRIVAEGRDAAAATAGDAMTSPCHAVGSDTTLQDCIALMEARKVRRVPVVDGDGRLAGIVSIADVALSGKETATAQVVREVSEPGRR